MPKVKKLKEVETIITQPRLTTKEKANSWWTVDKPNVEVFQVVKTLANNHNDRQLKNMMAAWMYQNQDMIRFNPGGLSLLNRGWGDFRVSYNVIASCIDTLSAKITKYQPYVFCLTNNGSFSQQKLCRNVNQFLMGLFDLSNLCDVAPLVYRDALVFGTGAFYIYADEDKGRVAVERVLPEELLVDEIEALNGNMRQLHRRKYVSKSVLKSIYGEKEEQASIDSLRSEYFTASDSIADVCLVVESWHLPSGSGAKDGRHTICIENAVLFSEEYNEDSFPFEFVKYSDPLDGFYGLGLCHALEPIQQEISKSMRSIQLGMHYFCIPRILREKNSQVDIGQMSNTINGQVIDYINTPPVFSVPGQVMSGDMYQWVEGLIKKAYEETGISQLSASSQKPADLESGEALRAFHNIETERFVKQGQNWERAYVNIGKKMLKIAAEMYKDKKTITVKVPGASFVKELDWKELNTFFKDNAYTVQAFPGQLLPQSPSGRFSTVQELMQAGLIDPQTGMGLLQMPDVPAAMKLQLSNWENAAEKLELIVKEGIMPEINPNQDLEALLKMSIQTAVSIELDKNVEDEHKELLDDFILKIKQLQKPPPAPTPQALPPAAPIGVPAAPPVSELMPITQ